MCLAIATDTAFYHGAESTTSLTAFYNALRTGPVLAPWNNIRYNTQTSNLALHGLHPHYQHFFINLPLLLGPALILLLTSLQPLSFRSLRLAFSNPRFLSAVSGAGFLSLFPHQEPRFLLPCVPLLLTCIRLPNSAPRRKWFWTSWLAFNILLGTIMGIYHQGGVIPAQLHVPEQIKSLSSPTRSPTTSATVFWWKTYPPPTYLLGNPAGLNVSCVALMGLPQPEMLSKLSSALRHTCAPTINTTERHHHAVYFVAPLSAHFIPASALAPNASFIVAAPSTSKDTAPPDQGGATMLDLALIWTYRQHVNLDDIDIAEDGLWGTLRRVVGRRGIGIWSVERVCQD